jgi:hypothetical protein
LLLTFPLTAPACARSDPGALGDDAGEIDDAGQGDARDTGRLDAANTADTADTGGELVDSAADTQLADVDTACLGDVCASPQADCVVGSTCCCGGYVCDHVGGLIKTSCCGMAGTSCTEDNDCCGQLHCPGDAGTQRTCQ